MTDQPVKSPIVGLLLVTVAATLPSRPATVEGMEMKAVDYSRRQIYHSPQTPGYTCWVTASVMPDGGLLISFTQATGPFKGRPQASKEIRRQLSWPPWDPEHDRHNPDYDMTGLGMANVYLRSADGGNTWQQAGVDPFKSCMNGMSGSQAVLPDGTVIRTVWGHYLPYNPELPKTGYIQRSSDGAKTWGKPELLLDPKRHTSLPRRVQVLSDGRLIVIGGFARVPANSRTRGQYSGLISPALQVSSDGGKTWGEPIDVVPKEYEDKWGGEEFDAAELANGDLLCVFRKRRFDETKGKFVRGEERWQGVMEKRGDSWAPADVGPAPFPHSGLPALLATREGVVLHVATTGVHWTADAGKSWHKLNVPRTMYYPAAVQTPDGWIYVFWHRGGDNPYGKVDQYIGMDRFRLEVTGRSASQFFVAPDGNDDWSGKLPDAKADGTDGPLATLEAARDAVRKRKASGTIDGPVTVYLRGGTYRLAEPLRLSAEDSGTQACPVTYTAYDDERAVLCGARALSDWTPRKNGILRCAVPEVRKWRFPLRQLFLDGERQVRARRPNHDSKDPLYGGWAFVEEVLPKGEKRPRIFRYDPNVFPTEWAKPEQGEIFIFPWYCWQNDAVPIKAVDRDRHTIELTRDILPGWNPILAGNRFYVENLLEELDRPGEWCVDKETATVYFLPPKGGLAGREVTIPINDRLIEIKGTPDAPVRFIRIEGLTFTQTRSLFPARGYAVQSDGCALYIESASDCRIAGNVFDQVGGDAVRLQGDNARHEIVANEISHAGAQGVCFYGSGAGNTHTWYNAIDKLRIMAKKPTATGNTIADNRIHHCGVIEKHAAGIFFYNINAVDNQIAHNLLHDLPRYGIALQVGLGGNVIEYNDIRRVSLETADTGGIETNRWFVLAEEERFARGNIIRHNLVCDAIGCGAYDEKRREKDRLRPRAGGRIWAPYYSWGIYFDNSPMDVRVYGNITAGNVLGGVMILGAGKNVVFENNLLLESSYCQIYLSSVSIGGSYGAGEGNRFVRNIVAYRDPEALLVKIGRAPDKAVLAESDYNLYYQMNHAPLLVDLPNVPPKESFAKWRESGYDTHSVIADPLFVDPARGDYRLRPDSPALKLGFKQIDVSRIGPRNQ